MALDPVTGPALCRQCGLAIIWALADNGRRVPIDPVPRDDGTWVLWWLDEGNVRTDRSGAVVPDAEINVTARRTFAERFAQCPGYHTHTSHLLTCPARATDPEFGRRQLNIFGGTKR